MPTAARFVVLAIVLAACKPSSASQPPTATPDTPTEGPATGDPSSTGTPGAPAACADEGTPWDGKPGTCFYEHGGCCYPTPESMCAAAGCDAERCMIMESSPAQARCADPAPAS